MFYYKVQVAKVTPKQVAAVREIVPFMDIQPMVSRTEALRVAMEKTEPILERYEYLAQRSLLVLPEGVTDPYDLENYEYKHYVNENENGWVFHLLIAGD